MSFKEILALAISHAFNAWYKARSDKHNPEARKAEKEADKALSKLLWIKATLYEMDGGETERGNAVENVFYAATHE